MSRVLLWAAGAGTRWWKKETPKHLVEVDGEKLICRTIRQLRERGMDPYVATNDGDIVVESVRSGATPISPGRTTFIVETMLATKHLWQGQMIGLFGDVFFTDSAMDTICASKGLRWFGRYAPSPLTGGPAEVFGVAWDDESSERFEKALQETWDEAIESGDLERKHPCTGSFWQPYWKLSGVEYWCFKHSEHNIWVNINDFTDDFDKVERYEFWKKRYAQRFIKVTRTKGK